MLTTPSVRAWCAVAVAGGVLVGGCAGDDDPTVQAPPTATAPAGDGSPAATTEATQTEAPTDTTTTAPSPAGDAVVIRYEGGEVVGGRDTVEASVGETVTITVEADVADEVHVHGYDIHADVAPDEPAELSFTADIPGQFEIELEDRGVTIADLEVR